MQEREPHIFVIRFCPPKVLIPKMKYAHCTKKCHYMRERSPPIEVYSSKVALLNLCSRSFSLSLSLSELSLADFPHRRIIALTIGARGLDTYHVITFLFLGCMGVTHLYVRTYFAAASGFLWSSVHVIRFSMDAGWKSRAHSPRRYIYVLFLCYKWLREHTPALTTAGGFSSSTSSLMRSVFMEKKRNDSRGLFPTTFASFPVQQIRSERH
jgi:hypothetical protein